MLARCSWPDPENPGATISVRETRLRRPAGHIESVWYATGEWERHSERACVRYAPARSPGLRENAVRPRSYDRRSAYRPDRPASQRDCRTFGQRLAALEGRRRDCDKPTSHKRRATDSQCRQASPQFPMRLPKLRRPRARDLRYRTAIPQVPHRGALRGAPPGYIEAQGWRALGRRAGDALPAATTVPTGPPRRRRARPRPRGRRLAKRPNPGPCGRRLGGAHNRPAIRPRAASPIRSRPARADPGGIRRGAVPPVRTRRFVARYR